MLAKVSKSDAKVSLFAYFSCSFRARNMPPRVKQMGSVSKKSRLFYPFCVIYSLFGFCQTGWTYRPRSASWLPFRQNRQKVSKSAILRQKHTTFTSFYALFVPFSLLFADPAGLILWRPGSGKGLERCLEAPPVTFCPGWQERPSRRACFINTCKTDKRA